MIGWSVLWLAVFILFLFFLSRRGRKRLLARLTELGSRVAQVEELLLEICAVLEEKEPLPPPLPAAIEDFSPAEERGVPFPLLQARPEVAAHPAAGEKKPLRPKKMKTQTGGQTNGEHPRTQVKPKPGAKSREKTAEKRPDQKVKVIHGGSEAVQKENRKTVQLKAVGSSRGRQINKERLEKIDRSTLPERSRKIVELLQQGLSVKEIARTTGMGQGEVQLIIDLYLQ